MRSLHLFLPSQGTHNNTCIGPMINGYCLLPTLPLFQLLNIFRSARSPFRGNELGPTQSFSDADARSLPERCRRCAPPSLLPLSTSLYLATCSLASLPAPASGQASVWRQNREAAPDPSTTHHPSLARDRPGKSLPAPLYDIKALALTLYCRACCTGRCVCVAGAEVPCCLTRTWGVFTCSS